MAVITVVELIVALVVGGLIGYVVAAHNRKANKEQVAALEAKVAGVEDKVKAAVDQVTQKATSTVGQTNP